VNVSANHAAPAIDSVPTESVSPHARVLQVDDIEKTYVTPEGRRRAVVSVGHFAMHAGEQIGIRGESGSGKTTFLNMIAGILKPDSGTVRIDGVEISALSESGRDRLRASRIGCVYQGFNLLQGYTCLENVLLAMAFGAGADVEYAKTLLARVDLSHRLHYLPRQLSMGQQQRVAVARALANKPKLLLADEPTGNLDARSAADAIGLLRQTCAEQGTALLVVSHDREILARFGRVEEFSRLNCVPQESLR
jgi:putative ABC transport system ATP-binding protein